MNIPVFDFHCDTALALLGEGKQPPKSLLKNDCHIDLDRAGKLPGYCQCFALFTTPMMEKWYGISPTVIFDRMLEVLLAQLNENSGIISQATNAEQIVTNYQAGKMSAVLTIEGPAGFRFDPARLEELYRMGFRITTLGWNEDNVLTGSHTTGGGLTDRGREYVKEAQRLGMIIDVSHISDKGFWDIMDITQAPVIASHSNSRFICPESRNLTDDMFRAICQTGGVAGINLYTDFIGPEADLSLVCDHILHWMELDPSGKHIAFGGDLDGCESLPKGFDGVQDYPAILDALKKAGVSNENLMDISWNNALGVMNECCM